LCDGRHVGGAKSGASSAKQLARDVIEEFMLFFAGMVAQYQPRPPGAASNPTWPNP
jgi:hypothetical protein